MYGVVLWSDQAQNRAVIWCEDHGHLAFFKGDTDQYPAPIGIEPGDLVQFEVEERRNMRLAIGVTLVASEEYPTLARDLRQAGQTEESIATVPMTQQSMIIPFERPARAFPLPAMDKRSAG